MWQGIVSCHNNTWKGETMKNYQIEIGSISADSHQIFIGDPCHVLNPDNKEQAEKTWEEICDNYNKEYFNLGFNGASNSSGLGVNVATGRSGGFPIYAEIDPDNNEIVNITIKIRK